MKPMLVPVVLLLAGFTLARPAPAAGQEHAHGAPLPPAVVEAAPDPLLRLMLEGPHVVLAHHGFVALTVEQLDALHAAKRRVCAAEAAYVHERTLARQTLGSLLTADADAADARTAVDRLAQVDTDWMLALVRARQETRAALGPVEREQVSWLSAHWAREAQAMIAGATHGGHRGHRGVQLPIRVPGMVVTDTAFAPVCDELHGPAVHLSVPPSGER